MLSVENRESEDPQTLGELLLYFVDELADVSVAQAFSKLMELLINELKERLDLEENEISEMIDQFMVALPPSIQRYLIIGLLDISGDPVGVGIHPDIDLIL